MADSKPKIAPIGFQPVTDEALKEATKRIVDALAPEHVLLFGSYAYGEPTPVRVAIGLPANVESPMQHLLEAVAAERESVREAA